MFCFSYLARRIPHPRTIKFFNEILPTVNEYMGARWLANRDVLVQYATNEINLAQLYNAINSPAAGNWQDPDQEPDPMDVY